MDAPTILGPAVRTAVAPLLEQAKDMLHNATAPPQNVTMPAVATTTAGATAESDSSTNVSTNTNHTD